MFSLVKVFLVLGLTNSPLLFRCSFSGVRSLSEQFIFRNHIESAPQPGDACVDDPRQDEKNADHIGYLEEYYDDFRSVLEMRELNDVVPDPYAPIDAALTARETEIRAKVSKWCMDPLLFCEANTCKCAKIETSTFTPDCYGHVAGDIHSLPEFVQLVEENDTVMKVCVRPLGSPCGMRDAAFGLCAKDSYCAAKYKHGKSEHFCGECTARPVASVAVSRNSDVVVASGITIRPGYLHLFQLIPYLILLISTLNVF